MRDKQFLTARSDMREEDDSFILYRELIENRWGTDDFYFESVKNEWNKVEVNTRKDMITGVTIAKILYNTIGTRVLPRILLSVNDDNLTQRAMISEIMARVNGAHSLFMSRTINQINSEALVDDSFARVSNMDGLLNAISMLEQFALQIEGWLKAKDVGSGVFIPDATNRLNESVWQCLALTITLLESSLTTPIALLFLENNDYNLDQIVKGVKLMIVDTTIMTNYLSIMAEEVFHTMTKDTQKAQKEWLNNSIKLVFTDVWIEQEYLSIPRETALELIPNYGYYNVNKAVIKLGYCPIFPVTTMPEEIKKHLNIKIPSKEKKKSYIDWFPFIRGSKN